MTPAQACLRLLLFSWLAYLAVSSGTQGATTPSTTVTSPPNVVLIISDDQAWSDYGFMGHPRIRTPHLDRLARDSATFPHGYVPTALCRPSLLTIITGLYAHQHGTTGNDPSPTLAPPRSAAYDAYRQQLIGHLDRLQPLPQLLGPLGYLSHQSGKWWEGNYQRGGFSQGMTRGFPQAGGRHGDDGLRIGREGMRPVLDFIDASVATQHPFFVWYAPFLPHTPHNPPQRLLEHYLRNVPPEVARYYAMCEWFDETCGALLDHLARRDLERNTLVVFVADNGWITHRTDPTAAATWGHAFAPRSKQSPYEGGVRTPILFRWPARIAPGTRDQWISSIDIVPTIRAAVGLPPSQQLPGMDLLPWLCDSAPWEPRRLFGEAFAHDIANLDNPSDSLMHRWCIDPPWKLILSYEGHPERYADVFAETRRGPQLFHLLRDPWETTDVAGEQPEIVDALSQAIRGWWPTEANEVQPITSATQH